LQLTDVLPKAPGLQSVAAQQGDRLPQMRQFAELSRCTRQPPGSRKEGLLTSITYNCCGTLVGLGCLAFEEQLCQALHEASLPQMN
jgi:hypothetical protein